MLDYISPASSCVNILAVAILILGGCGTPPPVQRMAADEDVKDVHSYANIDAINVTRLDLDLEGDFDRKVLEG
ncbi:MAG: hypothetical protein GY953_36375, partial [bacterium]|nr:hypothetical protein [bacterium]